ncbi:hypothetical protein M3B51_03190 [Kocuria carniphila]|uniref:hypothetical protein n=1 Tax=Kocuria carniphila TaxID=262208 RepID=UPI0021A8AE60|nr:hypothetical protein [Kocuria carniphila]MCT1801801.1 hypothetical protein [Kocuria carniphila]
MKITGNRVVLNLSGNKMQHVEAGDFISHLRTFQGGLELAHQSGKVSPAYTVVAPRDGVTVSYFKYVFKSEGYIAQIASVTDQLRDGQSMRYPEFNQTWLPLPPPVEQKQIADYLDHETAEIDAFIQDLQRFAQLSAERMESVIDDIIHGSEAPVTQLRRMKPIRTSGTSVNGEARPAELHELGVLKTGAASKGKFDPSENKAVTDPKEIGRLTGLVESNRVLVNRANTPDLVGSAVFVDQEVSNLFLSDKLWSIDFDGSNQFVSLALSTRSYREQISTFSVGASSSMQNLSYEDFLRIEIPMPPVLEQEKMAGMALSQIHKMRSLRQDIDKAIAIARVRRAALITAAVTGQIDVTAKNKPAAEQLDDDIAQGLHKES